MEETKHTILTENDIKEIVRDVIREMLTEEKEPLMEMARIGYLGNKKEFEVYIHTDDSGKVPHFHLRDVATRGRKFETCIEINLPRYFLHGRYKSKLNRAMKDALANFMEMTSARAKDPRTNYEITAEAWDLNNSDTDANLQYDADGNIIIPNYRNLN